MGIMDTMREWFGGSADQNQAESIAPQTVSRDRSAWEAEGARLDARLAESRAEIEGLRNAFLILRSAEAELAAAEAEYLPDRQGKAEAAAPRFFSGANDNAGIESHAAQRPGHADPDIGSALRPASAEIGGDMDARGQPLKALAHVGEWQDIRSDGSYWNDLRVVIAQDTEGFHYSLEARAENDEMQMVYWNGPHATVEDAKSRAADALDAAQRSWEAFSLGQDEEVEHEFREERNRSSLESSAERDRGEGMER